jgi:hypothetical protein
MLQPGTDYKKNYLLLMLLLLLPLSAAVQVEDALKLGALEFTAKFMLYFLHERLWASVKFL